MHGVCISTTPTSPLSDRLAIPRGLQSARLWRRVQLRFQRKSLRRRAIRAGIIVSNLAILAVIVLFVLQAKSSGATTRAIVTSESASTVANPLDRVSSADIALTVARLSSLPETTAITNQAQTDAADAALTSSNGDVIAKPQIVATALKSKADISQYTTVAGDTVSSLAARFGITSDSIRWSNDLNGDSIAAGTKLTIPPVSGIVYTVKAGDTPDSLASKFRADKDKIIAYNDAELGGLTVGDQIIIPNATKVAPVTASVLSGTVAWGAAPIYGYNGYDYGYCTWYVATQISVPANWGNASTWSYYAGQSGWNVSGTPTVGAIAQTPYAAGGLGHVAIVDAVSEDGSQIQIRDMNGIAGWGRVGYSGWISASTYPHYISH